MKFFRALPFLLALIVFLSSCQSTRVYVKSQSLFYDNDTIVEERSSVTRYDYKDKNGTVSEKQKEVEAYTKTYYDFSDNYIITEKDNSKKLVHYFLAEREITSRKGKDTVTFYLIETEVSQKQKSGTTKVLGQKKVNYSKGVFKDFSSTIEFTKAEEELYKTVSEKFLQQLNKSGEEEGTLDNSLRLRTENSTEKITVVSNTNGSYIAYSFLGKPFVIAGASVWNVLKCFGYAVINFMGGYAFFDGYSDDFWLMPSYSASKAKADAAKEANSIKYYPEYHIPFTNNHITVDKYNRDVEVKKILGEDAENITAVEHYEYDNTMSVTLSAETDAVSTAAVAGVVGTVITIPVSGASWIMGFVAAAANSFN